MTQATDRFRAPQCSCPPRDDNRGCCASAPSDASRDPAIVACRAGGACCCGNACACTDARACCCA
ncbi:MAG: hypothetical protein IT379_30165 [Deltaproteobacteria bacterium]|nr:hypothetical protein [Deltaproteobacteria bacterium]